MNHTSLQTPLWVLLFWQLIITTTFSQALPIAIDSRFDDWTSAAITVSDAANDVNGIDMLSFKVANDADQLFLRFEIDDEINLTEGNKISLYLDTDLNSNTGIQINDIGAELEVRFGEREAYYDLPSGQGYLSLNEINFRHQPSVTSKVFEISLDLIALSNTGAQLFTENGVRILWRDKSTSQGDLMPENGTVFTFMFDDSPTPVFDPIQLEKENENAVRVLSWNTLHTGLDDIDREPFFEKILKVIQPDIITFNECWDINAPQVASFMNAAVPLPNFQSWKTIKLDQGNITASRYPILQSWLIYPGHRLTASLIDIPDAISDHDLLVINAHFRCCDNNFERQLEADAFVKFILDSKTPGGVIDLPEGTPFMLSGDLNLVGNSQQLKTLLTGEIINIGTFGPGGPMDWDDSDLTDVISLQSDDRMAYTWRNNFSSYPPSRIDYHIISNSLEVDKSYTLEPLGMSSDRLTEYGLGAFDAAIASDHLPKVSDLILPQSVAILDNERPSLHSISPNPTSGILTVNFETTSSKLIEVIVINELGESLVVHKNQYPSGKHQLSIDLTDYNAGIYFLKAKIDEELRYSKIIKF